MIWAGSGDLGWKMAVEGLGLEGKCSEGLLGVSGL